MIKKVYNLVKKNLGQRLFPSSPYNYTTTPSPSKNKLYDRP